MRLGRNKFKLTTRAEVWAEWNNELKIEQYGADLKQQAKAKLRQRQKWEDKGCNLAFLSDDPTYNLQSLLEQSITGKVIS